MPFFQSIRQTAKQDPPEFELLEVAEYKKAVIDKDVQLVDVRTAREFRKGHLGRALNIDFYSKSKFDKGFKNLDKSRPVYIYCRSGHRSRKAAMKLIEMGFSKIYDLKGGLNNWQ